MNAFVAAQRWLYSTLTGSAALTGVVGTRIYSGLVPPGTPYPIALYTMPGAADDLLTVSADKVWSSFVYAVRVIDRVESYIPLEAGAAAIEAALHKESGSNVSGVIVASVIVSPFVMSEIDKDGFILSHLGSLVRLYVR